MTPLPPPALTPRCLRCGNTALMSGGDVDGCPRCLEAQVLVDAMLRADLDDIERIGRELAQETYKETGATLVLAAQQLRARLAALGVELEEAQRTIDVLGNESATAHIQWRKWQSEAEAAEQRIAGLEEVLQFVLEDSSGISNEAYDRATAALATNEATAPDPPSKS